MPSGSPEYTTHLERNLGDLLQCPSCTSQELVRSDQYLECRRCNERYRFDAAAKVAALICSASQSDAKHSIQSWWGDLYQQWYSETDRTLTADKLDHMLADTEDFFRLRRHLASTEMPLEELAGKTVLEIGSGGGAHSSLFKKHGASVVSVDITPARAASTALKLSLVEEGEGIAYLADGERLPFRDGSFDIVYSNGVLHHSENTERTIEEVHRVLKPGGKAVLMLYSRHSMLFWGNILPRAILNGDFFRYPQPRWIGYATEGHPKHGGDRNPYTRVYSAREIRRLLKAFDIKSLRKGAFIFGQLPIPGGWKLRHWLLKKLGHKQHPGTVLLYGGETFFPETPLEQRLSPLLGFAWYIVAQK